MLVTLREQATASRSAGWTLLLIFVVLLAVPVVPRAGIGPAPMIALDAVMA